MSASVAPLAADVERVGAVLEAARGLLARYGLRVCVAADGAAIVGSYWGEPEAGLSGATVHVRRDTPLHSLLHEACHYVCMSARRRDGLHTDAGGDYDEENGVCYLQIVLAEHLRAGGGAQLCADMDAWGYTFRLGSARAWFERDAQDARAWLQARGVLDARGRPTWRVRP